MTSPLPEPLIICDASPLILLAKIAQAVLVFKLAHQVWIPDVVWQGRNRACKKSLRNCS
jgi:hypothetical protein